MRTAIVILNWNGEVLLERYLPSVIRFSQGADIYVVDNASSDSSVAFLKSQYPDIKVIQNQENGGFAKGYNEGLKHIDADIFCLLNSDVEVTEGWLQPILKVFEEKPEVAIIQPKILDLIRKDYFEYAGAAGGFLDQLGYPFCR
ncbi:MAG: glycosyltransferase, partial [Pricia sp.]|nr:glycosyltransferase [Pricia sp.]